MSEVNKKNIPNDYSFFSNKLDNDFKLIIGEKSTVIFGFNGIGKSTLFRIIKAMNFSNVDFTDYDHANNGMINNTEIKLSYHINEISKLNSEIKGIKSKLQITERLKNNGLSNSSIRKAISLELEANFKKKNFPSLKSTVEEVEKFYSKFPTIDMKIIFSFYSELQKINKIDEELEKNKKKVFCNALEMIKNSVDMKKQECPVCGSITNWQETLDEKITELASVKSDLIEKYKSKNYPIGYDELNRQIEVVNYLNDNPNLLFDLSLSSSVDEYIETKNLLDEQQNKTNEMKTLLAQAKKKYELVLSKKYRLESDMKRYFNIERSEIVYDDNQYIISITFPREIKTYSTGEINLITFLYSIYSFLGSDRDVLVLDDPVSSLDMINQYKIAFEIVNNSNSNKHMLIFTHSTEFINIINSQLQKSFKYFYLEESNGVIYLDEIKHQSSKNNPNIISIDKIKGFDNEGLINYLMQREDNLNVDYEVLHYADVEHFIDNDLTKLSNYKLIELIDNFTSFNHKDFYENSYNKIKYLVAIRVWIEKQLYFSISPNDTTKRKDFFKKNTLEQRIDFIIPRGCNMKINNKIIEREQLMCKKVMLNQGVHYNSQVAPFAYAINLSLDDLSLEINSIKQMF